MEYQTILDRISEAYRTILRENLVGIYVHGSIALGCFHWDKSDIDFIVVVDETLSHETKKKLMDFTVKLNEQAPPKGLEMSVVRKKYCQEFQYPTPFELHFSNLHKAWYRRDPDEYCEHMQGEDKDLAAHFTIIRQAGIVLVGKPVCDVFGEVPRSCYLDSIQEDIQNAKQDILLEPLYIILNMCRVAVFLQEGRIVSKKQAGEWGRKQLKREVHPLIDRALHCYQTDETMRIEEKEADEFCEYMFGIIKGVPTGDSD